MSTAALYTWMITILFGLLLLIIWIIEYDRDFQSSAATRLPVPVIFTHAILGMGGLVLWIAYLLIDQQRLAWATVAVLGAVACLGLTMAARWVHVYRTVADPGQVPNRKSIVPPERNFPVPVVITHGILAFTTIGLVVLTTLRG
jgi:manganese efflux pump family protein